VDEELDGEIVESQVAAREYSMLIQRHLQILRCTCESQLQLCCINLCYLFRGLEFLRIVKNWPLTSLLLHVVEDLNLSKELYKQKSLHSALADSSTKSVGLANALHAVPIYLR
jgi:hypothetical protein